MDFTPSPRSLDFLSRARSFIAEHISPIEKPYLANLIARNRGADWTKWEASPLIDDLKTKARSAGLWNLFLPDRELGAGLSTRGTRCAWSECWTGRWRPSAIH